MTEKTYNNHYGKKEKRSVEVGKIESQKRRIIVEPYLPQIEDVLRSCGVRVRPKITGSVRAEMATPDSDTDVELRLPIGASSSEGDNAVYHYSNNPEIQKLVKGIPTKVHIRILRFTLKGWEEVADRASALGF